MTPLARTGDAEAIRQFNEALYGSEEEREALRQRVIKAAFAGEFSQQRRDWDDCEEAPTEEGAG